MDPSLLPVVKEVVPALVPLVLFAAPVCWYWIKKNHDLRVKELELEAGARLQLLEKRLAAVEATLGATPQVRAPERPELFEAPPQPIREQG